MGQRRRRRFHFEALWTRRVDCKEVIKEAWNESLDSSTLGGIADGLKRCANALTAWSNAVFGHTPKKIQQKKKALSELTKQDRKGQNGAKINRLRKEINEEGDRKTQSSVVGRGRSKHKIFSLKGLRA